jgi:threonyl-tRNA synthetase
MKILMLHCDYIKFQALKKALRSIPDLKKKSLSSIKDPLVILTAVEKEDTEQILLDTTKAIKKQAKDVGAKTIVVYPYAHISSNLSNPEKAQDYLKKIYYALKKDFKVEQAPFGYYKSFELKCKGHPLSELSKSFTSSEDEEEVNIEELVKKMEKVKMSTQKAPHGQKTNIELGRDLDLYIVSEIIGQGLPLLTPKGTTIKREIENFITNEEIKRGYLHTSTPMMAKSDLYKVSGHWQHYRDSMFVMDIGKEKYALRPMTCPFQFILYKRKARSYKDLPLKYAEIATLFRNEKSGELRGLTRVRQMTLADAHIICTPEQVEKEFEEVLSLLKYVMKTLGVKGIWYRFSKWDPKNKEKYIDNPKSWESSQKMMKGILDKLKVKYIEEKGEAAFYGPKLDLQYKDVFGKEDTLLTIQIDFALPERYNMTYKDKDNKEKKPMIIHRSSTGTTERMISYILEHTQGNLPLWLSPTQVRVLSFTDKNIKAAEKTLYSLKEQVPSLRIDSDFRSTTVNEKVRDAEMQKIPYIIVIGDKEEESKTLAVRNHGSKPKFKVTPVSLIKELKEKIEERN